MSFFKKDMFIFIDKINLFAKQYHLINSFWGTMNIKEKKDFYELNKSNQIKYIIPDLSFEYNINNSIFKYLPENNKSKIIYPKYHKLP